MEIKSQQIWKHYKGALYKIITLPKSSVDEDMGKVMVVYQDMTDESKIWVQPIDRFTEMIAWEGKTVPRFEFISDNE